jgi:hypothetical protein
MKHFAVISEKGELQYYPFKEWFRSTQKVPGSEQWTTHQMRSYLIKKKGWTLKQEKDRDLVIEPSTGKSIGLSNNDEEPTAPEDSSNESARSSLFALESHLREYLAKNINSAIKLETPLQVVDVEHPTGVGPIDLLAQNKAGDYFVFELKLDRGVDAALGQLLRYMGWVKKHMANGHNVSGIILASEISDKLRYAVLNTPDVKLMEYELQIKVRSVASI